MQVLLVSELGDIMLDNNIQFWIIVSHINIHYTTHKSPAAMVLTDLYLN